MRVVRGRALHYVRHQLPNHAVGAAGGQEGQDKGERMQKLRRRWACVELPRGSEQKAELLREGRQWRDRGHLAAPVARVVREQEQDAREERGVSLRRVPRRKRRPFRWVSSG